MYKHAVVVTVAVLVSLAVAKGLVSYAGAEAVAKPHVDAVAPANGSGSAASGADASHSAPLGAAEVSKSKDGHYWAEAEVNGHWVRCLIDTGATVVALRSEDAARLGLDPGSLHYDVAVNTANGQTHAAQVELDHVSVAGARVDHVPAMVVQDGLAAPLLGMSYLGRLSRFEATPTTLILRP